MGNRSSLKSLGEILSKPPESAQERLATGSVPKAEPGKRLILTSGAFFMFLFVIGEFKGNSIASTAYSDCIGIGEVQENCECIENEFLSTTTGLNFAPISSFFFPIDDEFVSALKKSCGVSS